jgi:RNA polymerase primary sigma factor
MQSQLCIAPSEGLWDAAAVAVVEVAEVQPARPRSDSAGSAIRTPSWLGCGELAEATAYWQLNRWELLDGPLETLQRAARGRLQNEIGFITHPQFDQAAAGESLFACPLALEPASEKLAAATLNRVGADLPACLGRLCEAKLLTPAQETLLFERMNFLRHQATQVRSALDPQRPSRRSLELLDRLLVLADWHRDRIVEANVRLVFSIVKKFVNSDNSFDDLLSDGIVALMRAVDKFDVGRGFRFSTYATQVVRRNAYRDLVQGHQERAKMVSGVENLDMELSDEYRQSAISEKRWHELRARLSVMLDALDRREKFIIRARFSLGSHRRVHTLQALANRLGVSKERVRQLEHRAMEKLRSMVGESQLAELAT